MDRLSAPQQNAIGAYFANLLRKVEQDSGPEFLPRGLDIMGLVRQLALPSAETVEKLSYGDPLFRMPTQSNIPITTDRGYVAEVLGMAPAVPAASRATTRISNEVADQLVKAITRNPDATAVRALDEIGRMSPVPQITTYHGSPSLFREFDPSADPMGRKRNAYGYGAGYTTESKDVANLFKEKSSVWTGEEGYLYKGEIPDELLGGFLKWDEPIKNQTKEIRELAKRYDVEESDLGGDLVSKVGKTKEGTDVMLNSGITGIEYKKFGDEPSNYVVFRPEDFRIQEINDIPIEDYYARGLLEPEAAKFEMPSFAKAIPETSEEIDRIYDYLEDQAKKAGFKVRGGSSNVSGSRYLTIVEDLPDDDVRDIQVRISNHGDRHPFTEASEGKISIDPSMGGTDLEQTLYQLQDKGFNLIK
jgi:hypothetical protein